MKSGRYHPKRLAFWTIAATRIAFGVAVLPASAVAGSPADLFAAPPATSQIVVDHRIWDRLVKSYVHESPDGINRVDYRRIKSDAQHDLRAYIANLEAVDVRRLNRADQFALLANLYNAKTVDIVASAYPVKSIKDISLGGGLLASVTGGPWKAKVLKVNGQLVSLDDIEHGILRPVFKDPRVHFAVNCASIGCPNLQREAFIGAELERQLDAAARAFVNHPRGVSVGQNGVVASSIYNWFMADFGNSQQGILQDIGKYAAPELKQKLTANKAISEFRYDWSLNDIGSTPVKAVR